MKVSCNFGYNTFKTVTHDYIWQLRASVTLHNVYKIVHLQLSVKSNGLHVFTFSWSKEPKENCVSSDSLTSEEQNSPGIPLMRSKHKKGSKERLLILTRTHSMQISREIPFIKPQNDIYITDKRLKITKNARKRFILFWLSFAACSVLGRMLYYWTCSSVVFS